MMKRLSMLAGFALVAGLFVGAPFVHAQLNTSALDNAVNGTPSTDTTLTNPLNSGTPAAATPAGATPASSAKASGADTPTNSNVTKDTANSNDAGYDAIMSQIMRLFAWLVGAGAVTLDAAAYYSVVHMGALLDSTQGGLTAVGVAWRVLRDIANIVLIFGFLAVGICVIIDVDWYGGGTKILPTLILVAIFMNFSMFVAEAIIDVSNLIATQVYSQINGGKILTPGEIFTTNSIENEGISNRIMSQVGLQTVYDSTKNNDVLNVGNLWVVGFMAILLFLIAAFVMFSLALILVARLVILIFLIIISPLGFAALAVPGLEKHAHEWWHTLLSQAFAAPMLLLLLYVALAVITNAKFLTGFGVGQGSDPWKDWINNGKDVAQLGSVMLAFLIAMGLLMAVVIISKKMAVLGADWATKAAGTATFGAVAFASRRTVGRGANALSRTIRSSRFGRTDLGRLATFATDKAAKSSFDLRGSKMVAENLKSIGVDAGAASKANYAQIEKQAIEDRTKYAKSLELTGKEEAEKKTLEARQAENKEALDKLKDERTAAKDLRQRRLDDAGDYKPAQDEAKRLYNEEMDRIKAEETRLQGEQDKIKKGEFDETGKQVKKGLDDFTNIAQKQYAASLQSADSLKKIGLHVNAAGFGAVVGAVPAAAGGAAVGAAAAAAGYGVYLGSAAQSANKRAAAKILKEAKKSGAQSDRERIKKLLEDEGEDKTKKP